MGASSTSSSLELKNYQKASSFFRRLVQRVRLSLTDVTVAQLITKEITNRSQRMPEVRIMRSLSKAAFEIDDYWRIVKILHRRFKKFDMKNWRKTYKALILLEHLLTYGPKSSREEFETDAEFIKQLRTFQYIDERGYNWGQSMKEKAERVVKLLENGPYLAEERDRLRGVSGHIQGYGSFSLSSPSIKGVVEVSRHYERSNSNFEQCSDKNKVVLHGQKENSKHDALGTQELSIISTGSTRNSVEKGYIVVRKKDQLLEEWQPLLAGEDDVEVALPAFNTKSWVAFI